MRRHAKTGGKAVNENRDRVANQTIQQSQPETSQGLVRSSLASYPLI